MLDARLGTYDTAGKPRTWPTSDGWGTAWKQQGGVEPTLVKVGKWHFYVQSPNDTAPEAPDHDVLQDLAVAAEATATQPK